MGGGGAGAGAASPAGPCGEGGRAEWLRIYGCMVALLRKSQAQVEALLADRSRLEAFVKIQHEFWVARVGLLQAQLQQMRKAEASRRRCEAANLELLLGDKERELRCCQKLAELTEDDLEDFITSLGALAAENSQLKIKLKEVGSRAELSEHTTDHEHSARDLRAEIRKLKQAYKTLSSKKDKELSALLAEKDFVWNQLRTMEQDYTALLKSKKIEAAQATEAAQKLEQNVEELQVATQQKDGEIGRLRANAADAKKKISILEDMLQEMRKNQRMADDQSVVGRRRIYYDPVGNEALICSESDDEIPEPEEEKHVFTGGEDQLIWKATQEYGLSREVVNVLCQFIDASPSEIEDRSEVLFEKNEKHSGSSDKIESQLSLDKTMDVVLDSFDNLFCRRCLVFDCRLHGCSQNFVFPNEKQPYGFELDENKRPCGDQCYLRRREGFQDIRDDDHDACATYNTESRTASHKVGINILSESEDSNREEDNIKSSIFVGTSRSKIASSESAEKSTTPPSGDTSETENISTDMLLRTLGKRKISKHGPRSSDDSPDKKQKTFTSDISFASNILNKHSIPEIGDTRPDSRESGGDQLPSLDDPNKKTSNKDMCGGSPASTTEDAAKDSNKVWSAKNLFSCSREHTLSRWSALERDLYLKGIEIFGKNSCLIARNLLSGLKTCMEVASYMYNNGAAMAKKRPLLSKSILGDFAGAEQDYMEQDMAARTRICRRRGRTRKLKYTWKSAGHPAVRKRIGDGKQWYTQYTPCGCQQMCGKDCPCVDNGTCCEKYCGCSKSCKNRFRGCHCAKSQCRSRQCPCFAASRECDPDVCRNCWVSCGDGSLGEPPARGDGYQCGNMKLLLKQQQRILLGRSDVEGWGAFIKNPVHKNDYLGEYTGELISHKEADKRGKIYDRANSSFLFDLNDQYVLDAYRKGDKLKFANHSSNPNCYAKVMLVAGDHRVGIYAKEHIEASEELFYDYRYGPDQAPAWARRPEGSKKDEASVSHHRAHKVA